VFSGLLRVHTTGKEKMKEYKRRKNIREEKKKETN